MPQELLKIPEKAQERPKKNRPEKPASSELGALEKKILENLEKVKKELMEINFYLQLGTKKIPKEKLLARKEELETLISIYQGLLEELKEKKQKGKGGLALRRN